MRVLRFLILVLLLTGLSLEGYLRLVDPYGLTRMLDDLNRLQSLVIPLPSGGYGLQPGHHDMAGWSFTILPDGTRAVPASHKARCTIALLGDSVAMGWDVNDADTWVNRVAQELPTVHLINAGVVGYNIQDVAETAPRADAYLYLLIDNDDQPRQSYFGARTQHSLALQAYLAFLAWHQEPPGDKAMFTTYSTRLIALSNLQVVAFAGEPLARYFPHVQTIPPYTHRISRADPHADATGNEEIAQAMLPILQSLRHLFCDSRYNAGRGE